MYRGGRGRGSYHHSHSFRDTNSNARYYRRSESPAYRPIRRSRGRSRSPQMRSTEAERYVKYERRDAFRGRHRERFRSREDERHIHRVRRSFSSSRSRAWSSRSPPRRLESRDRSRSREEEDDWKTYDSSNEHEQEEHTSKYKVRSDVSKRVKNDRYHWTSENYKKNHVDPVNQVDTPGDSNSKSEEIHDLREIIKRGREESTEYSTKERSLAESDEYFKEFVPNVKESKRRQAHSRWSQNEDKEMQVLTFKKSIHNEIADEDCEEDDVQIISVMDSNPRIPFFNGMDQDLTPRQFVKLIEELGYKKGWNSNELKCQMAAKLQGSPREWFLKDELMNESWERVKVQFIKMHPMEMDYYQQVKKMMDRTRFEQESFSNYFTYKTMLMSAVDITGRKAVSCLIGGLRDHELETKCYQKNFATPELLFDYLNSRKESRRGVDQEKENSRRKSSRPYSESRTRSEHHKHSALANYKVPLLKTPGEPPMPSNSRREENFQHSQEAYAATKPSKLEYDQRHLFGINIRNHQLDAYNDLAAQCVTIKEESAKHINLEYSRRRTTIIGFRGVPVMALGDADARVGIDQATVTCTIFIVPNICQEKAVVVGKSLREHQDLSYREGSSGIVFKQKAYPDSFSANEKRKEKSNHIL